LMLCYKTYIISLDANIYTNLHAKPIFGSIVEMKLSTTTKSVKGKVS